MQLEFTSLETKRLWLRPIEIEDAADLFSIYGNFQVMSGNSSMPPYASIDDMVNAIKTHFLAYRQRGVPQGAAIELKETGVVIGVIDFHTVKKDIGELGYMLNASYWQQGYMREAIAGMLMIGFQQLGLHRIEAMVEPNNKGSWKALESNGFQKEGVLRKYMKLNDDVYHDLAIYSILKEEYLEEEK